MKRVAVVAILLMVALSGCFKKESTQSTENLEEDAWAAMDLLAEDFGPGGDLRGASLKTFIENDPVDIPIDLKIALGADDDILITMDLLGVVFKAYCSDDMLVLILRNTEQYGVEPIDIEMRNLYGPCLDKTNEDMTAAINEFVDIRGLLMVIRGQGMDLVAVGDAEEADLKADFNLVVPATKEEPKSEVQIEALITDGRIVQMITDSGQAHMTLELEYVTEDDPRATLVAPPAAEKVAAAISGSTVVSGPSVTWTGVGGKGGPEAEYSFHVLPKSGKTCGGTTPVATFALADGMQQETEGFRFTFTTDGDPAMGKDDVAVIRQPDLDSDFEYKVILWDDWADAATAGACTVPGAPIWGIGGLVLLGALVRRRF